MAHLLFSANGGRDLGSFLQNTNSFFSAPPVSPVLRFLVLDSVDTPTKKGNWAHEKSQHGARFMFFHRPVSLLSSGRTNENLANKLPHKFVSSKSSDFVQTTRFSQRKGSIGQNHLISRNKFVGKLLARFPLIRREDSKEKILWKNMNLAPCS